jgi:hypothetical protein
MFWKEENSIRGALAAPDGSLRSSRLIATLPKSRIVELASGWDGARFLITISYAPSEWFTISGHSLPLLYGIRVTNSLGDMDRVPFVISNLWSSNNLATVVPHGRNFLVGWTHDQSGSAIGLLSARVAAIRDDGVSPPNGTALLKGRVKRVGVAVASGNQSDLVVWVDHAAAFSYVRAARLPHDRHSAHEPLLISTNDFKPGLNGPGSGVSAASDGQAFLVIWQLSDFHDFANGVSSIEGARIDEQGRIVRFTIMGNPAAIGSRIVWSGTAYVFLAYVRGEYKIVRLAPDGSIVQILPAPKAASDGLIAFAAHGDRVLIATFHRTSGTSKTSCGPGGCGPSRKVSSSANVNSIVLESNGSEFMMVAADGGKFFASRVSDDGELLDATAGRLGVPVRDSSAHSSSAQVVPIRQGWLIVSESIYASRFIDGKIVGEPVKIGVGNVVDASSSGDHAIVLTFMGGETRVHELVEAETPRRRSVRF